MANQFPSPNHRLKAKWVRFKVQQMMNLSLVSFQETADIRCSVVDTFEPGLTLSIVENVYVSGLPAMMYRRLDRPFDILRQSVNYGDMQGVTKAFLQQKVRGAVPQALEDAICLAVNWSANYWHWLFENLPKVVLAERSGFRGVYLVPDQPYIRESLEILGIDAARVIPHDGRLWQVRRLHVPTPIDGQKIGDYPLLTQELRRSLRTESRTETPKRIYISRNRGNQVRRIVNEADFNRLIERYSFETWFLEDLTFRQQLALFSGAEAVIGPHGAGFANTFFLPEGALVIELFSPVYVQPVMLSAMELLKHRYYSIVSYHNDARRLYRHGENIEAFCRLIDMTLARELNEA